LTLPDQGIWPGVANTIAAHPDASLLRAQGLSALAAAYWNETDHPIADELDSDRASATALGLQAERMLHQVADLAAQPFLLMKGPELATRYPEPGLRELNDLDLLVLDTSVIEQSLLRSGWSTYTGPGELRWYDDIHHARPLVAPGSSLPMEPHRRPNWPTWGRPPEFAELHEASVASTLGIEGVRTPSVEHHALLVLAHSWAHMPFERFSQLIDFALLVEECNTVELAACARRWQLSKLLSVGLATIDSVLLAHRRDSAMVRWFAPHLRTLEPPARAREQLDRYMSSFLVTTPTRAASAMAAASWRRFRVHRRDRRAGQWNSNTTL
jgi:hypothetical protein